MPLRFRRALLVSASLLAAVPGWGAAQAAEPPCEAIEIRGIRPGMTVREVRQVMGGRAVRLAHLTTGDGVRTNAVYARSPYTITVHYDGEVTRRATAARVIAVELTAAHDGVDADALADQLLERLGAPASAPSEPFAGTEPTVWSFPGCGATVSAGTKSGNWWNPAERGSLVVRMERSATPASEVAVVSRSREPGEGTEDDGPTATVARPEASPAVVAGTGPRGGPPEAAGTASRDEASRAEAPTPAVETAPGEEAESARVAGTFPSEPPGAAIPPVGSAESSDPEGGAGPVSRTPSPDGPFSALGQRRDRAPERLDDASSEPRYPVIARRMGLTAEVELQIVVRQDGTVGDIRVARSSRPGHGFEKAAIDAVRAWRYQPALRAGRPIDAPLLVVVNFR